MRRSTSASRWSCASRPACSGSPWRAPSSARRRDRYTAAAMTQPLLVVRSRRVVTDAIAPAAIHVRAGRIERVAAWDDVPAGARLADGRQLPVVPGIVDTHVHLNEPGRTEWEGFATATRAAAIGGVTAL